MHILIAGAGAIGSALTANLLVAEADVTLIARGERLAYLKSNPLELQQDNGVRRLHARCCEWREVDRPVNLTLLCTKTVDLAQVISDLAPLLAPDAIVVTTQNGVEAPDFVAAQLPNASVVATRVHGFFQVEQALVRHVGVAPSVEFGCIQGDNEGANSIVRKTFEQAGFNAELRTDIRRALWEKFLLATPLGGVAAKLELPAGQVLSDQAGREMLQAALGEVVAVANAFGETLDDNDIERTLAFIAGFPPSATTSLQRDLATGRPSEYDALPGAVVRMARDRQVPHPTFEIIDRAVNPNRRNNSC